MLRSGVTAGSRSVTSLTDDEVRVVDRLRPAVSALFRRFDADLQREQRLSHGDYIVLFFVSQAPDRTLGLSLLAARCQQSLSAVSRTIGRLKADGLVRREQSAHDARAYNAILSRPGSPDSNGRRRSTTTVSAATCWISCTVSTCAPSALRSNALSAKRIAPLNPACNCRPLPPRLATRVHLRRPMPVLCRLVEVEALARPAAVELLEIAFACLFVSDATNSAAAEWLAC